MPTILADNGGYDSSDLVSKLRAAHYEGRSDAGLGMCCNHGRRDHADMTRHGHWRSRFDEGARCHRILQAEEAGRRQCKRGGGDDLAVSFVYLAWSIYHCTDTIPRVDNILRSAPRRREGQ
jgi:hypothetical protein